MVEQSNIRCVVNVDKWLQENEANFKPPVCNSIMAGGFLKIMFVGGPNTRKDYHLDQGEEVFVLPSRIPHSPQRKENTLGLVIERHRPHQWDGIRYYCDDGKTILWQKYFHLHSLVEDLPPVIKEFFASEQYKTGKPIPGTTDEDEKKLKVDKETVVSKPFLLDEWISTNEKEIQNGGKLLFGKGEFKIHVYGHDSFDLCNQYETWIWLKNGSASCKINDKTSELLNEDSLIIPAKESFTLNINKTGYCLVITTDPNATPQI